MKVKAESDHGNDVENKDDGEKIYSVCIPYATKPEFVLIFDKYSINSKLSEEFLLISRKWVR